MGAMRVSVPRARLLDGEGSNSQWRSKAQRPCQQTLDLGQAGFGGRHLDQGTGWGVVVLHKVVDFAGAFSNAGGRAGIIHHQMDGQMVGHSPVNGLEEGEEILMVCRRLHCANTLPVATSSTANKVVVLLRISSWVIPST